LWIVSSHDFLSIAVCTKQYLHHVSRQVFKFLFWLHEKRITTVHVCFVSCKDFIVKIISWILLFCRCALSILPSFDWMRQWLYSATHDTWSTIPNNSTIPEVISSCEDNHTLVLFAVKLATPEVLSVIQLILPEDLSVVRPTIPWVLSVVKITVWSNRNLTAAHAAAGRRWQFMTQVVIIRAVDITSNLRL
jgi:hypothetical protein